MTRTRRFANEPAAVTAARRFATETLTGLAPDVLQTAELLASELSSNCVRHTDSAFEISIATDDDEIRIAATDWGAGEPVMQSPEPTDISGRGLALIDIMSAAWGIEHLAASDQGKVVWFTLSAPVDTPPEPARPAGAP
jgi:anti-sigma regulatory factor (Ser/Thr protein kinase)